VGLAPETYTALADALDHAQSPLPSPAAQGAAWLREQYPAGVVPLGVVPPLARAWGVTPAAVWGHLHRRGWRSGRSPALPRGVRWRHVSVRATRAGG
jgi:hypothetical protein